MAPSALVPLVLEYLSEIGYVKAAKQLKSEAEASGVVSGRWGLRDFSVPLPYRSSVHIRWSAIAVTFVHSCSGYCGVNLGWCACVVCCGVCFGVGDLSDDSVALHRVVHASLRIWRRHSRASH